MTVDVERISFEDNCYHDDISERVAAEGLPKLFSLFDKYDVKATFYVTAKYSQLAKQSLVSILEKGHEIGCHVYDHSEFYDIMNYNEQCEVLTKSKKTIEKIIGNEIISFRAPALRINKYTVKALETVGFKTDSSVASQRFDGPFTTGAIKKLSWLTANRKPYKMSYSNPYKKGGSSIFEIPITAFIWPFIGTHMRISPKITSLFQMLFTLESMITKKPLVFLIHPNECLNFKKDKTTKRGNYFSDVLRHNMKMKNLGEPAIILLKDVIIRAKQKGANFISVKQYLNRMNIKL
jgi:peptidoglycan/xylan/chitin deacetylase (PgdA/CDA1 family)